MGKTENQTIVDQAVASSRQQIDLFMKGLECMENQKPVVQVTFPLWLHDYIAGEIKERGYSYQSENDFHIFKCRFKIFVKPKE